MYAYLRVCVCACACACAWISEGHFLSSCCSHRGANAPSILFPTSQTTKWSPCRPLCEHTLVKKQNLLCKYVKGQEGLWPFKKGERGPMTWLHKYEMYVGCCWHITAKNRSQINIHTHWKLSPIHSHDESTQQQLCLLFWWTVQVAFMDRKIVYGSLMTRHLLSTFVYMKMWDCKYAHSWLGLLDYGKNHNLDYLGQ